MGMPEDAGKIKLLVFQLEFMLGQDGMGLHEHTPRGLPVRAWQLADTHCGHVSPRPLSWSVSVQPAERLGRL